MTVLFSRYFSVMYGTVFGMALASFPNFYENSSKRSTLPFCRCLLIVLLPLAGLCSYIIFSQIGDEKENRNKIHPFITWIPVSYLISYDPQLIS